MTTLIALTTTLALSTLTGKASAHHSTVCHIFGNRCAKALRIVRCESGFDPRAVGRAGERGLTQIHPGWFWQTIRTSAGRIHVNPARLFEPTYNLRVAYVLSNGGRDWSHWTCSRWTQ